MRYAVVTVIAATVLALDANATYHPHPSVHPHATEIPGATLTHGPYQEPLHTPVTEPTYAPDGDQFVLIIGGIRPDPFVANSPRDPSSNLATYNWAVTGTHPSYVPPVTGTHAPVVVPLPAGWLLLVSGLAALRHARRA